MMAGICLKILQQKKYIEVVIYETVLATGNHWYSLMYTQWFTSESVPSFIHKTYPISSFHQEIIGGWIPFPVGILRNTDSPIMRINLEGSRCFIALEPIIKRILNQAIESCIRIWGLYLQDRGWPVRKEEC